MIDLERDFAALLGSAPDPPPLSRMLDRARRRRRRRRGAATIALALTVGLSVAAVARARANPTVTMRTASGRRPTRVTSLYGTTLDIQAWGYALGSPRFDATVQAVDAPFAGPPSIVVTQSPPPPRHAGAVVYVARDHRDLYAAHTATGGDQLVGRAGDWTITITVDGLSNAERARLASLLRFRTHAGFLVVDPVRPLRLVPSVGSEVVFDGIRIDASTYPQGCPNPSTATNPTPPRLAVEHIGSIAIWCDPTARIRIQVEPPAPVDAMLRHLHITRIT